MTDTISYYNESAAEFITRTVDADMEELRMRFLKYLEKDAVILDAGCGSGRDTKAFLEKGYSVEAFDASEEICNLASAFTGISVKCCTFEELDINEVYDGIWACASLLHVDKNDFPEALNHLYRALKPGGVIYASLKYGSGERISDGKYYLDVTPETLEEYLKTAGFIKEELFVTGDVREQVDDRWVNIIARKEHA